MIFEELPNISVEYLQLLFFIIPGFLLIKLFDWLTSYQRKLNNFEWTIYSIPLSVFLYLIIEQITPLSENISDFYNNYFIGLIIAFILTIIIGVLIKSTMRKNHSNTKAWTRFAQDNVKNAILVTTFDDKKFYGRLKNATVDFENNQDIIIQDPELVTDDWTRTYMGEQLFIPKKSVRYIISMESPGTWDNS